jgi:hypothetical protein
VTGTAPYGANTRVVIMYDQWGTEDLVALYTQGIGIAEESTDYATWKLLFTGVAGGLLAPTLSGNSAAWELTRFVAVSGFERTSNSGLKPIWGVEDNVGYMCIGLWQENADLHWRVNGSSQVDWADTDYVLNADVVVGVLSRTVQDYSNVSNPALGNFNGVQKTSRTYAYPITYPTGNPFGWGDWSGLGSPFIGSGFELHILDASADLSAENLAILDAGIFEFVPIPPDEQKVYGQNTYVIEGQAPDGQQLVTRHNIYVIET